MMTTVSLPEAPKNGFTASYLEKLLKPQYSGKTKSDPACSGLVAEVGKGGHQVTFYTRYRDGDTMPKKIFGKFVAGSDNDIIIKARRERELLRGQQINNELPSSRDGVPVDVEALANEWYREHSLKNCTPETAKNHRRIIDKDIIPVIGKKKLPYLKPVHFVTCIKKMVDRDASALANTLFGILNQIDQHAVSHAYYDTPLMYALKKSKLGCTENIVDRTLDFDIALGEPDFSNNEMRQIYIALDNDPRLSLPTKNGIKLLSLLTCRTGELREAKWSNVDWERKLLFIPKLEINKGNKRNTSSNKGSSWYIPLSEQSIVLLQELYEARIGDWVLQTVEDKPIDRQTLYNALVRLQNKTDKSGEPILQIEHFTPHSFRRTFNSHASKAIIGYDINQNPIGIPDDIAERCLNHSVGKIMKTYKKDSKIDERRIALQAWSNYVYDHVYGANNVG